MTNSKRVELSVKSHHSIRECVLTPEDIIAKAEEKGICALAICDSMSIRVWPELEAACKDSNVRPVLGVELNVINGHLIDRLKVYPKSSVEGIRSLFQIITKKHNFYGRKHGRYGIEAVDFQIFKENRKNLIVGLSADGPLTKAIVREENTDRVFDQYLPDFVELSSAKYYQNFIEENKVAEVIRNTCEISKKQGVLFCATSNAAGLTTEDIEGNKILSREAHIERNCEVILPDTNTFLEELTNIIGTEAANDAIFENPKKILGMIQEDLCFADAIEVRTSDNGNRKLRHILKEEASRKNIDISESEIAKRIECEMKMIQKAGLTDAILATHYVVSELNKNGAAEAIPLGGFGNLLIGYLITNSSIDPLAYSLEANLFFSKEDKVITIGIPEDTIEDAAEALDDYLDGEISEGGVSYFYTAEQLMNMCDDYPASINDNSKLKLVARMASAIRAHDFCAEQIFMPSNSPLDTDTEFFDSDFPHQHLDIEHMTKIVPSLRFEAVEELGILQDINRAKGTISANRTNFDIALKQLEYQQKVLGIPTLESIDLCLQIRKKVKLQQPLSLDSLIDAWEETSAIPSCCFRSDFANMCATTLALLEDKLLNTALFYAAALRQKMYLFNDPRVIAYGASYLDTFKWPGSDHRLLSLAMLLEEANKRGIFFTVGDTDGKDFTVCPARIVTFNDSRFEEDDCTIENLSEIEDID